jgi:hypothetical protein
MAMAFESESRQSLRLLMAMRRLCSFVDSILDKIEDSRVLGRKTFPIHSVPLVTGVEKSYSVD